MASAKIRVVIPGPPQAQGRGRIVKRGAFLGIADPRSSAEWKAKAAWYLRQKCAKPLEGPLEVYCQFQFACPQSEHRKRNPRPARWHAKARPDVDNLAKCILDASQGVLFVNDGQVAKLTVEKRIGVQGDPPWTVIEVSPLEEEITWQSKT